MSRFVARASQLLLAFLLLPAGCEREGIIACQPGAELVDAPPGSVRLAIDAAEPELDPLRRELPAYLARLWSVAAPHVDEAPSEGPGLVLWISGSEAARVRISGEVGAEAYALARIDEGARTILLVYAPDARARVAGAYALLEELGLRFFHPLEELVPQLGSPKLPAQLSVIRSPMVRTRGLQIHTLHPVEYLRSLLVPSEENLREAQRLIDWLVKTGQNHLQWFFLESLPFDEGAEHWRQIVAYAHARGVTVAAVVLLFAAPSGLQGAMTLITDEAQPWEPQLEAKLERFLALGFDGIEIGFGEFLEADPEGLVARLDHAVAYAAARYPGVEIGAQIHVGNYANLYISDFRGEPIYFYHLPRHADPRLGVSVHTLNFFDLYRDWATYKHPDFHFQRDFLLEELGKRRVWYFPESAYWVTADIDVPQFLPEYVYARHLDITRLHQDVSARGQRLDGHLMFSSGHEWGYWMTDYLSARLLWEPTRGFDSLLAHYGAVYGSCAPAITKGLSDFTQLQSIYLFEQRLMGYLAGEDFAVDAGTILGFETHPTRLAFEEVLALDEKGRAAFGSGVLVGLDALAGHTKRIEQDLAPRCRGMRAPQRSFCDELLDGYAIVRLRAEHAAATYRSVLALAEGDREGAEAHLGAAREITGEAGAVISRREGGYRWKDDRLTGLYENATIYPFGLLRQASTQCFWRRRELQVETLLRTGRPAEIASLPGCQE